MTQKQATKNRKDIFYIDVFVMIQFDTLLLLQQDINTYKSIK